MTAYIKLNGTWTPAKRVYLKRNNVWTPSNDVFVKSNGAWANSFHYDKTPPNPPEISLQLVTDANPRYIKVGARVPGTGNDTDVKLIRVLYSASSQPTTPLGSGYIKTRLPSSFGDETWSDWMYNGANGTGSHKDTSVMDYKYYPPSPTSATNLPGHQFYWFSAWSMDFDNNWSSGVFTKIWMPRDGVAVTKEIIKETSFEAVEAGTVTSTGAFTSGELDVNNNPVQNGVWYYGTKITDAVGSQGSPDWSTAETTIRVSRGNDTGQGTANVRVGWFNKNPGDPVLPTDIQNVTVVGTINKGQTSTFTLPSSWQQYYNTQIKGVALVNGTGAQDYLVAKSLTDDLRNGELHLHWNEIT